MKTRYQVIYEDPAQGWIPTGLGIFDERTEAEESARHWMTGYATRGLGEPRVAIQAIEPRPLPEGATLIRENRTMRPEFEIRITTLEEAKAFLTYLHEQGLSYHPEDRAEDCLHGKVSRNDAGNINYLMGECWAQAWPKGECPCSFILDLDPEYKAQRLQEEAEADLKAAK